MIEIKDLLLNFRNRLLSEEARKGFIQDALFRIVNISVERDDIEIKNGILYLKIKPIYKNEVFMKRYEILSEIKKSLGKKSPTNIR